MNFNCNPRKNSFKLIFLPRKTSKFNCIMLNNLHYFVLQFLVLSPKGTNSREKETRLPRTGLPGPRP